MNRPGLKPQRGVALVVALILLVVMTLLGLAGLRTVTLQEKMTASSFDRSLAFQAAESALREGEALVQAAAAASHRVAGSVLPASCTTAPCWELSTGWRDAAPLSNGSINVAPEYLLEYLGVTGACDTKNDECHMYRITARIKTETDRSQVMLQSTYVVAPIP